MLPASTKYFYHERGKLGLVRRCKSCHLARTNEWKIKHRDDVLSRRRENYSQNRAQMNEYQRKYYREHLDQSRDRQRRYGKRHPDRKKQSIKNWRIKNQLRISRYERQYHPKRAQIMFRWRHTEHGRKVSKTAEHRRRARKLGLPYAFTVADWNAALDYWENRCAACGCEAGEGRVISRDHWIPLSSPQCPGTIPTNIVPLCHGTNGCNDSKRDTEPMKWLIKKFGELLAAEINERIKAYFEWIASKE